MLKVVNPYPDRMQTRTDTTLQREIIEQIRWCHQPQPDQVSVSVLNGVVTLYGVTDSYAQKRYAQLAAEKVKGVKFIAESIEVLLPTGSVRSDTEIASAVQATLAKKDVKSYQKIKVSVNGGLITLEGEVTELCQKTMAEQEIADLPGIYGVNNMIDVKPVEVTQ